MAGDWIKWTKGLPEKPEVIRIAGLLGIAREVVVCRLMRFWEWCDDTIPRDGIDDVGCGVVVLSPRDGDNVVTVDAIVSTPGFASALVEVGWVKFVGGRLEVPNFGRHNGETAKTRARNTKNQQDKRSGSAIAKAGNSVGNDSVEVTILSPAGGDKMVTREEKRREEKENTPLPPATGDGVRGPSFEMIDTNLWAAFATAWQEAGLSQGQKVQRTANRVWLLQQRLADANWREKWREAIARAGRSARCTGQTGTWSLTINAFLKDPDMLVRLLEGEFDDCGSAKTTDRKFQPFVDFDKQPPREG